MVMLIALKNRLRRLIASWRKDALPGIERGSREGRPSSLDLRTQRKGSRSEFEQMAQRLGVDIAELPLPLRGAMHDAEHSCAQCHDVRRCRRWLAQETVDDPQLFCPNAPLFKVIAERQTDARRRGR